MRAEKHSGTTWWGREELQTILDFSRPVRCRINRLARSIGDLQNIARSIKAPRGFPEGDGAAGRHEHRAGKRNAHLPGPRKVRPGSLCINTGAGVFVRVIVYDDNNPQ